MNHDINAPSTPGWLALCTVLAIGLVQGLIFVFGMPPWQHYDEPTHFEYAWLFANYPDRPQVGDSDPAFKRQALLSMIAHNFYHNLPYTPDPNQPATIYLGVSQLDEPPFYYWLVSLPLRVLRGQDIAVQLYAGRLVSLLLYLVCLLAAWGLAAELFAPGSPLRWTLPLTLALLPGFIDTMTGVNNDALATAACSLFLWAGVSLTRRGFAWLRLLAVLAAVGLCLSAKSTAYIALPLLPVVLLFTGLRGRWRRLAWGVCALAALLVALTTLEWGDAALWYRSTSQAELTRASQALAAPSPHVIQLDLAAPNTPVWSVALFQPLPIHASNLLSGKRVTLGAWMWASHPLDLRTPILCDINQSFSQVIHLDVTPAFYAFSATLDGDVARVWVRLAPLNGLAPTQGTVYYDNLVLAEGERPAEAPPHLANLTGETGEWGGRPFTNLLRNPSAEMAGPRFRPWADQLGARLLPDHTRPSLILTSLLDQPVAGWFYRRTLYRLNQTFWGMFGWGHVPLLGWPYRFFAYLSLLALVLTGIGLIRRMGPIRCAGHLPWELVFFLGLALAFSWGATLVRGPLYLAQGFLYLPVARYAQPAILATALVLAIGWFEVWAWLQAGATHLGKFSLSAARPALLLLQVMVYCMFLLGLNALAWISIFQYYAAG